MQAQLLQFAEEKVQLGQQANDLLTMHNEELEKVRCPGCRGWVMAALGRSL